METTHQDQAFDLGKIISARPPPSGSDEEDRGERNSAGGQVRLNLTALSAVGASFLLMGALVASYGPLLEHLTGRFHVSLAVAGSVISIHAAGALVGVVASVRAMERIDGRSWVGGALVVTAAGCAGVALAPDWPLFLVSAFTIGVGFGALDLGLNQLVAHSEGARRTAVLNVLNGAFALGAVAAPILVSAYGSRHLAILYSAAGALALGLILPSRRIRGRLPVVSRERPRRALSPLVAMFVLAYVFYVGTEIGIGGWMPSHLEALGLGSLRAAALTSGFWLAVAVGRLLVATIPDRVPQQVIVLAASGVAALGLMAASFRAAAPFAYVFTGLAIAPIWSTGLVWLARLRPGDSRATAWLFPASMLGGVLIPGGIGLLIGRFGIGWTPAALALVAVCSFAGFLIAGQLSRSRLWS